MSSKFVLGVLVGALAAVAVEEYRGRTARIETSPPASPFYSFSSARTVVKKWEFSAAESITGSPALAPDGTLYLGSNDGFLYALDPTGKLEWKFHSGPLQTSPLLGSDGTIYVTNTHGRLYAIKPSGAERWHAETADGSTDYAGAGAAIDGDWLYTDCQTGLCSSALATGALRWYFGAPLAVNSAALVLSDGSVVFSSRGRLFALGSNGVMTWALPTLTQAMIDAHNGNVPIGDRPFDSPMALSRDGTIYVGTADGHLFAVHQGGQVAWDFKTLGRIRGSPVVAADGTIYIGSGDQHLYALRSDGTKKWDLRTQAVIETAPVLAADGTIYIAHNLQAQAVSPEGKILWELNYASDCVASPTLAPDGTLYVALRVGKLYALAGSGAGLMASSWPKFQGDLANSGRAKQF